MKKSLLILFLMTEFVFSQSGWVQQLSNTTQSLNSIFCLNSNAAWVCGGAGVILKTTNGGTNWVQLNSSYSQNLSDIFFNDSQTGWVCGGYLNFPQIALFHVLKTTNGGTNWNITSQFGSISSPFIGAFNSIRFTNALTGFVTVSTTDGFTGSGYILRSTNGGLNWSMTGPQRVNMETNFLSASLGYLVSRSWDDVGHDSSFIFKTTDLGLNWILLSKYRYIFLWQSSFININTGWIAGKYVPAISGEVFKTTDGGMSLTMVHITSDWINSVSFSSTDTGFVCGPGIYRSVDGGSNWTSQPIQIQSYLSRIKMINNTTGWCIGSNGVILRTTTGGIDAIEKISDIVPKEYSLRQNYPNPFNPVTYISFEVPEQRVVKLIVFDAIGRFKEELVNEKLSAGIYEVSWDAANYSSGVYYYRLEAADFIQTGKMILLK